MNPLLKHKLKIYLPALVSAFLLWLSFPPFSLGGLIWIALLPLLWSAERANSAKESAVVFGLAGLIFYTLSLCWFARIFGAFAVSFFCLLALFWPIFGYFYFQFSPRQKIFLGPILWVGLEFFRSEIWYFEFPWLSLGLAHHTDFFSSTLQLASIWGVYGNSFIIILVNILLAQFFLSRNSWRTICLIFALLIPLLAVPVLSNFAIVSYRMSEKKNERREIKVLLIQSEGFNFDELERLTFESKFKGGIVLWPEEQLVILPGERLKREIFQRISNAAQKSESYLFAGCAEYLGTKETSNEKIHNHIVCSDPHGAVVGTYTKRHLIPLLEKFIFVRGESSEPLQTPAGKIGRAICYDMDFSETFVKLSRNGAEVVMVPSLDPERWGVTEHLQHASIVAVRAVESRKWVARAASSGPSQIVDPLGAEIAKTKIGETTFLKGTVLLNNYKTPYHRWLWIFPWICFWLSCWIIFHQLLISEENKIIENLDALRHYWRI